MVDRVVVLITVLCTPSLMAAAEIRLRSSVVCAASIVRLADVAEIRADDPAAAEALGLITVCPAPSPGIEQTLTQHHIRQHLALSGVEPAKIVVTGSDAVLLMTDKTALPRPRTMPVSGAVRQALHSFESSPDRTASLARLAPPAVAPVTAADSKAAQLVERGAGVTIHSRKPGVRITASGKALQAGAAGELIGVELADSKQRVMARVIGPQTVEVAASASAPTKKNTNP